MLTRLTAIAGPLNEREFRFLYLARALSLFGDGLLPVALPFATLSVDRSPAALGYVLASRAASLVIFLLVAGVVADRLPRKRIMIAADLIRFLSEAVMAVLLIGHRANIPTLIGLVFLFGIGDAFFRPTSTGFVPETISRPRLQQANALLSLTTSGFAVLGPVVAAALIVAAGPGYALAVDAATFLLSAAFVAQIRVPSRPQTVATSFIHELAEGWSVFRSRTWLWVDGVYSALASALVLAPFLALGPVAAARFLGGAPAWAAVVTGFGIGAILGGASLFRIQPTRPLLSSVPLLVLVGIAPLLLAIGAPTWLIAIGAVAGGFGLTFFNTLFETTVQRHVPPESLSRVASIDWMMSGALQPLGLALAGPAALLFGLENTLLFASFWIVLSTAIVLAIPDVRNLTREPLTLPIARAND